jgi:Leucine-rich repeat (LRR) protein
LSSPYSPELNNNLLFRLEDLNALKKYTPALACLNLRSNLVCENKSYRGLVLRRLTVLCFLDGVPVSDADRAAAAESSSTLTPQVIRENAFLRRRTTWSLVSARAMGAGGESAGGTFAGLMQALKSTGGKATASAADAAAGGSKENDGGGENAYDGTQSDVGGDPSKNGSHDSARALTGVEVKDGVLASNAGTVEDDGGDWWCQVEEVVLEHRRVRRLQNLERLTGMRRASFCDNEVSRLEGLEECTALEELSLEQNRVVVIEGLQYLTALKKLDLGKNRITRIENLAPYLAHLTQLSLEVGAGGISCRQVTHTRVERAVSRLLNHPHAYTNMNIKRPTDQLAFPPRAPVLLPTHARPSHARRPCGEDNDIASLQGLTGLNSLMELYIGNNNVAELREVQRLKSLPKLIIVDLLGNPLCTQEEYRSYIVYHLRRIKVLDGSGVEATEQAVAKNRYAGKLTRDYLEDKIGQRYFDHLRELDLCQMRVRDIGDVFFASDFEQLEEINLDSNLVSDPSGLCALPKLAVLRMNGNRIEDRPLWTPQTLKSASASRAREVEKREKMLAVGDEARVEAARTDGGAGATGGGAAAAAGVGGVARLAAAEDPADAADAGMTELLEQSPPFPSLEVLQLGANSIVAVSSLRLSVLAKSLKVLFLQDNDISKLEGLEALCNLEELVLDRNRIKFLDPSSFAGLVNLRELRMEENGLRSLSHLSPLTRLHALHLTCNRVVEVAEVEKLVAHPELYELTLLSNPVTRKQVYRPMVLRHCPGLRYLDGKEVTMEERDHVDYLFSPVDAAAAAVAAQQQMQMNANSAGGVNTYQHHMNYGTVGLGLGVGMGTGGGMGPGGGLTGVGLVPGTVGSSGMGGPVGSASLLGVHPGGRMPVRVTSMNFEALVVNQVGDGGEGGSGSGYGQVKGSAPPSKERMAALQADLRAGAAATVAAQHAGAAARDRDSGRTNRFQGRQIGR